MGFHFGEMGFGILGIFMHFLTYLCLWRYCKCEMPYNPDDLMVQCEGCKDWYLFYFLSSRFSGIMCPWKYFGCWWKKVPCYWKEYLDLGSFIREKSFHLAYIASVFVAEYAWGKIRNPGKSWIQNKWVLLGTRIFEIQILHKTVADFMQLISWSFWQ